jgi:hypothetical protein
MTLRRRASTVPISDRSNIPLSSIGRFDGRHPVKISSRTSQTKGSEFILLDPNNPILMILQ